MGHMLHNFTDGLGHAVMVAALKAHDLPGYRPQHRDHGGECALTLGDVPCLVRYEMTSIGADVTEVSVHGSDAIPAGYFDADTLTGWQRDIERSRDAAGYRA